MKRQTPQPIVEWAAIESLIEKLGGNRKEIAEAIGIGESTFSGWASKKAGPKWAYVALEGLYRRANGGQAKLPTPSSSILVIRASSAEDLAAIELLLEKMKVKAVRI